MAKIALQSLGCKLNQAETESMIKQLLSCGYQLVESPNEADVYVLNTCTVTHIADRKTRQLLRSVHRSNPEALIIATGCYAERAPQELEKLGIVSYTVSNKEKNNLVQILKSRLGDEGGIDNKYLGRSRSTIKIQEGCNNYCSFCIVPYARGGERSLPLEVILKEVRERIAEGYKEITITGTKIGAYKNDERDSTGLSYLIEAILKEKGIERLRLSSLQPQDLTSELVRLWDDKRLCPHIHVSLQSGSQSILEKMRRGYTIDEYEKAISFVREMVPDLSVTTDIIVGFPGEGEKEFEESYRFCDKMGFANIHVFPFSPRSGTRAAEMSPKVEERVKKERSQRMLSLARRSASDFRKQYIGRTMSVLWETQSKQGSWSGMTDNYLRVFTESDDDLTNKILMTRLVNENSQGLLGEIDNGGKV